MIGYKKLPSYIHYKPTSYTQISYKNNIQIAASKFITYPKLLTDYFLYIVNEPDKTLGAISCSLLW